MNIFKCVYFIYFLMFPIPIGILMFNFFIFCQIQNNQKMNYWLNFFQTFLLILIFSHFVISMKNENEDLNEEEALLLLPEFMRNAYATKNNAIGDNVDQQRDEAGYSRSAHFAQNEEENTVQALQNKDEVNPTQLKPASLPQKEQPLKEGDEPDKNPAGKLSSRQRRRENRQKQNAANEKLKKEIFRGDGDKGAASSLTLDKSFKEKLMDPSSLAKIQFSSISSSRKEKQQHSYRPAAEQQSSNNDRKGNSPSPSVVSGNILYSHSSTKHQQSPRIEGVPSRTLKETPEGASHAITVRDTGDGVTIYDLLAREKLTENNRYNRLEIDQQKQLLVKDKFDEYIVQSKGTNQQGNWHELSGQSKGKAIEINAKEEKKLQIEKEKEEEKMLREEIKNAAKQRWDQDQFRKHALDNTPAKNMVGKKEKKLEENLRQTVIHGYGETSGGNNGSTAGGGRGTSLETTNSRIADVSAPASNISAVEAEFLLKVEANEKFIQIKNILKNLKEKLNELTELENNWLSEKIILFRAHIKNRNPNEKENEIIELINNLVKQKELLKNEEKKKADLKKDVKKMKEEISKSKTSNTKNRKELKNLENKLNIAENNLLKIEKPKKENKKKIDELEISLLKEFIEMKEKFETDEIKMIQEKMKEPLKYFWTAYELVLIILNKQWQKPYVMDYFVLKRPYHYISAIFGITLSAKADGGMPDDIIEFNYIMRLALLKMLRHHNFYSTFNSLAYEKLKCFDVFSEKMSWLIKERQKYAMSENHAEHLEIFGKYFKEELNKSFHDVFHFNMVGLDQLPDVWDKMVLEGIGRLAEWLPKDRQQNFNEIWAQLYEYYKEEKRNLKWLSQYENDKLAMKIFDLFPDEEYADEEIKQQISIIKKLSEKINSTELSDEVKDFISNTFGHIQKWIQSINMLLKIQKREKYALPYLKSVYDKYWYIIYKDRFNLDITSVEKDESKAEKFVSQINSVEPDLFYEMIKVTDVMYMVTDKHGIFKRGLEYEIDKDFMDSITDENQNEFEYNWRMKIAKGEVEDRDEKNED